MYRKRTIIIREYNKFVDGPPVTFPIERVYPKDYYNWFWHTDELEQFLRDNDINHVVNTI